MKDIRKFPRKKRRTKTLRSGIRLAKGIISRLTKDQVHGYNGALDAVSDQTDFPVESVQAVVEAFFAAALEQACQGKVVKLPGLGMIYPWASPLRPDYSAPGAYRTEYPLYCVLRFRPDANANAQVILRAPVRLAANALAQDFFRRNSDNTALRQAEKMVSAGTAPEGTREDITFPAEVPRIPKRRTAGDKVRALTTLAKGGMLV